MGNADGEKVRATETTEGVGGLERLARLVATLCSPQGCPWDREQGVADLRAYLIEEAHEAAAAIDGESWEELAGELGDLLYLIVFVTHRAAERGAFTLGQVVDRIEAKMIRRHPHVFGDTELADAEAVRRAWEEGKAREKRDRRQGESHLDGVPDSLPALLAAYRMGQKAAGVGFDWPDELSVLDKVDEELGEVRTELAAATDRRAALGEEVGDLLFSVANLARHLQLDPEATLAAANRKFRDRFTALETQLAADGRTVDGATPAELDAAWRRVKSLEKRPPR